MINFKKLSISQKIFAVTSVIFAFLLILSVYAFQALNHQKNVTKSLYFEDLKRFRDISSFQINIKEIQENVFRELNWYQAGYDDKMIDSIAKVINTLRTDASSKLLNLINNSVEFKDDMVKVDSIYSTYQNWLGKVQEMASTDPNIALIYMGNADNIFIILSNEINEIHSLIEKGVEDSYKASLDNFILTRNIFIVIIVVSVTLSLLLTFIFSSQLIKSFKEVVNFLKDMAQGNWDLRNRIESKSYDELGQVANWVDNFINKLQDIVKVISDQTNMVFASSESLISSSNIMTTSSKEVKTNVGSLKNATDQANESITNISQNVQEMSESISTIASSIDEINATINEISKNCQEESRITAEANVSSKKAVDVIDNLGNRINEIEKIIETINDIADQTNMLALNASIEAASAGEAGKGFTVVANEVKELAKQTSKAIFEIENQINEIQFMSSEAVSIIRVVGEVIEKITLISSTIASSIEEQSITVNEISSTMNISSNAAKNISDNVNRTALSISNISTDVQGVSDKVGKTDDEVGLVRKQADDLKEFADKLHAIVEQFIT